MATKKQAAKKISFNKFFPEDSSFVTLNGKFNPEATSLSRLMGDLDVDLVIQNGTGQYINLYTWLGEHTTTLKHLKAIQEATTKAIKFIEDVEASIKEAKKKEPIKVEPRVTKQRK